MQKRINKYEPLLIPINKPFVEFSKNESKEYFDWFISHIDERAEYVRNIVSSELEIPIELLDYSLESTKLIWKWFLSVAEISKTPRNVLENLRKSLHNQPQSFIDHMIEQAKEELSVFTEFVLLDIGMYISKLFKSNYSVLRWTIKRSPKNYVFVNQPILVGFVDDNPNYPKPFYPDLEPVDLVRTAAINLFDHTETENDLYNICKEWIRWIPE